MNYMDLLGGGFPPGFEGQIPQPQQMRGMQGMGGLFGGGGPPPQASQLPGVTQMPRFGQTPLQGMGLQSPFLTERPQQAMPTQGFVPSRTNAMSPQAMAMMGMNPNMPNMVGPTSALPAEMQPQASQLKMWGMEDQMAQPTPGGGGGGGGSLGNLFGGYGNITDPNILVRSNQVNLRNGDAQSYANPFYGMTANPNLPLWQQMQQLGTIQSGLMGVDSGYGG